MAALDAILESLDARGIILRVEGDRLRAAPSRALTEADRATIAAHKPQLLAVTAYRDALHRLWRLMAEGHAAKASECAEALADVGRRMDDVGMPAADRLRHRWEIEWHRTTGRCSRCGAVGESHGDPAPLF